MLNGFEVLAAGVSSGVFFGIPMLYWIILGGSMLLSWMVGNKLKSRFREHSQAPLPYSGREVAEKMLADAGIRDVRVISTPGQLTDHYNPSDKTVNLSEAVYNMRNVAAAAVAAHECGHAVQHAKAYVWLKFRSAMVPVTNIASSMMNVIFMISIVGMIAFKMPALLWLFVGCLAITTLFAFVTLPVEFDASMRALAWMEGSGVAASMDQGRARNALFWAAMTYVVGALSSLTMLAYYLFQMFGGNDD
ncbi:MAG: Zn-dependent membrane protease YugP [Akkermansiaceae bacterium]|jgi:Zn-dependent membrane protease YugP